MLHAVMKTIGPPRDIKERFNSVSPAGGTDVLKACEEGVLTPADQDVSPEVFPLGEERDGQQSVQIETFHQQPEEAGHDAVLEEHDHHFAADLGKDGKAQGLSTWIKIEE